MNPALRELYQDIIVDHSKHPRNFGPLAGANRHAEGFNPLCGDRFKVHLKLDGGRIVEAHFEGSGCAISTSSASVMTEALRGKTLQEAEKLFQHFQQTVTSDPTVELPDPDEDAEQDESLERIAVFGGVREFPARVKCATLAWHAMRQALEPTTEPGNGTGTVKTE